MWSGSIKTSKEEEIKSRIEDAPLVVGAGVVGLAIVYVKYLRIFRGLLKDWIRCMDLDQSTIYKVDKVGSRCRLVTCRGERHNGIRKG